MEEEELGISVNSSLSSRDIWNTSIHILKSAALEFAEMRQDFLPEHNGDMLIAGSKMTEFEDLSRIHETQSLSGELAIAQLLERAVVPMIDNSHLREQGIWILDHDS